MVQLYAPQLLGLDGWAMTGIDPEGCCLRLEGRTARLQFDGMTAEAEAARGAGAPCRRNLMPGTRLRDILFCAGLSGNIFDRPVLCFDSAHFVQKHKVEALRRAAG